MSDSASACRPVLLALLGVLLTGTAAAQDAHYGTLKYGSSSTLLGGQVIGAPVDLGTTFYNPGGLALVRGGIALDLQIYELRRVEILGGQPSRDVAQTTVRTIPALFVISLPRVGQNHFAASFVTRQNSDLELRAPPIAPLPAAPSPAARTDSQALYRERTYDAWAGLTWARPLGTHLGIGATLYGGYRTQENALSASLLRQAVTGTVGASTTDRRSQYDDLRLIGKLGVVGRWDDLSAGVALGLPSLHVAGRGGASVLRGTGGLGVDGMPDSAQSLDVDDQPAEFRTPWDVGVGLSFDAGLVRVFATAEWFSRVGLYDVIRLPSSFAGSDRLTQESRSVVNWGAALEYALAERVSFFASFARDGSARPTNTASTLTLVDWDLYAIGAGFSLAFGSGNIVAALQYSWGEGPLRSLSEPIIASRFEEARVRDRSLVVAFALSIGKRETEGP